MNQEQNSRMEIMQKISSSVGEIWKAEEIDIIQRTVAKGTNEAELRLFLNTAKTIGLNPFNKEIWCYKDNSGNVIIFTGRDGFLKKAQEQPAFNGLRSCEVCANDEFEMDIPNGKIHHRFSKFDQASRGPIVGAYAIVFRKDGESTIEMAPIQEYKPANPNRYSPWSHKESEMIKKCAESKALKKAFGFGMLQSSDEWRIESDQAVPINVKEEAQINPEEKRVLDFIKDISQYDQLRQISDDLIEKYPSVRVAYDVKVSELMDEPIDHEEV